MDKGKQVIEKFKNDMGFENCSITKIEEQESGLVHKNFIHKIEMECSNFYKDIYNCSTSIKSDNGEIIKSNCEKKHSPEDKI
ncbi:MAG: hypothetical protein ACFFDK_05205 [Promethearchaeota archaeon]